MVQPSIETSGQQSSHTNAGGAMSVGNSSALPHDSQYRHKSNVWPELMTQPWVEDQCRGSVSGCDL